MSGLREADFPQLGASSAASEDARGRQHGPTGVTGGAWTTAGGASWKLRLKTAGDARKVVQRDKMEQNDDCKQQPRAGAPKALPDRKFQAEMTEAELEAMRERRRQSRKEKKARIKKAKEEAKRLERVAPKTTKIQIISKDVLKKTASRNDLDLSPDQQEQAAKIRFMDEEYPDLAETSKRTRVKPKEVVIAKWANDAITGRLLSDPESASEWETEKENESCDNGSSSDAEPNQLTAEVFTEERTGAISYSSILKNKKPSIRIAVKVEPKKEKAPKVPISGTQKHLQQSASATAPKTKKKDALITFDLLSALQSKSSASAVTTKKSAKTILVVPNKLDSTAPARRRGKERETPRKKRMTALKQAIMAARREKRRLAGSSSHVGAETSGLGDKEEAADVTPDPDGTEEPHVKNPAIEEGPGTVEEVDEPADEKARTVESVNDKDKILSEEDKLRLEAKKKIHSKRFRDYCNHALSKELDSLVQALMADLIRFQDKLYANDPVKAKAKRRYVVGMREIHKFLKVQKVQLLILAPDLERVEGDRGLNNLVDQMIAAAKNSSTPVAFSSNRRGLGRACRRKVPVAGLGIMNYQGSDENFKSIIELIGELQKSYEERIEKCMEQLSLGTTVDKKEEPLEGEHVEEPVQMSNAEAIKKEFLEKIRNALQEKS